MQRGVLLVRRLPEVDGTLTDKVKESVGDTTAREGLNLPELNANPFRLHTLLPDPYLNGLPGWTVSDNR